MQIKTMPGPGLNLGHFAEKADSVAIDHEDCGIFVDYTVVFKADSRQ